MSPPSENYALKRVFSYGRRRAYTVKINLPMCKAHYEAANFKSPLEKSMEWLSLMAATVLGLAVTIGLLRFWSSTGQGNPILNLFSGGIMGAGAFIVTWAVGLIWLAPLFAAPESKAARQAVRIKLYRPQDQSVRLEFQDEQLAGMVEAASNK
jgi:hypothetical protein